MSSDVDIQDAPRGQYLNNRQAAKLIGVHPVTLAQWRMKGRGPKYSKVGDGQNAPVRYTAADVHEWMRQFNVTPEHYAGTKRGAA